MSASTDPDRRVRFQGVAYRVCVYRTARGWAGFVEDRRFCHGFTGEHGTERAAWLSALRVMVKAGAS